MCDCDCDAPSVYNESNPKARKPRKCTECRRTIEAGEAYRYIFGVWDGDASTFSMCGHCVAGQQSFAAIAKEDCYCLGSMWMGVRDHIVEAMEPGPEAVAAARLWVSAQRKWTHRRGPHKGQLMPVPVVPVTANVR